MVNTILKEADLFCPNSVRINFTIYHFLRCFFLYYLHLFFYLLLGSMLLILMQQPQKEILAPC
uniref:Uncharacterized protein n=1 Tax=Companilactobacillus formosensis TaxID=1617889 RepID=A0A2P4R4M1_9LACO